MATVTARRAFEADSVLANHRMLDVSRRLGFPVSSHSEMGVVHVTFPITPTRGYDRACQNRRSTIAFDDEPTARRTFAS